VHLVGFIIRMYHDAQSPERQMKSQDFRRYLAPNDRLTLSYDYSRMNSAQRTGHKDLRISG